MDGWLVKKKKNPPDKSSDTDIISGCNECVNERTKLKIVVLLLEWLNGFLTFDTDYILYGGKTSVGAMIKYSSVLVRYEYIVTKINMNVNHLGKKRFIVSNDDHYSLMKELWVSLQRHKLDKRFS